VKIIPQNKTSVNKSTAYKLAANRNGMFLHLIAVTEMVVFMASEVVVEP